jgi:DNA-binding CsgD family transcriptional regulator
LKIEEELGDRNRIGKRHLNIVSVFLEMEELDQCGLYIGKACSLIDTSAHSEYTARLDHLAGRYYLKRNDPRRAIESFSRSLQYAEKFQLKPLEADNLKLLSEAHEKTGDPRTSLGYLKSYLILKEEMFREESDEKMAEFHARYQNEQIRLENEMLRQDAQNKMNLFITGGIVLLVLILLLLSVIFLLRLRAKNARQSKIMAEQHTHAVEMELELRNKELTCNAIAIIKKNETVAEIVETLEKEFKLANTPNVPGALIEKVRILDKDAGWKEFEMRFTQVHQDFYERLHERFPDLTPNERKLCAFLRLNMSTKDIASITRQSVHSINVARTRMRKKLGLANSEENLIAFLSTI